MKSLPSVLMTAFFIIGCAPLSQAPLVYSSKQILGVDISVPSPESPTAELHVGFKNKDVAIVPVAVAKLPKDHSPGNNEIQLIRATYSGSINPGELQAAMEARDTAKKDSEKKWEEYNKAEKSNSEYQAKEKQLIKLTGKLNDYEKKISDLKNDPTKNNELSEIQKERDTIKTDIEKLSPEINSQIGSALTTAQETAKSAQDQADAHLKKDI